MKRQTRRTKATRLVAGRPLATVTESGHELRLSSWRESHRDQVVRDLRNVARRIECTATDVESGRLNAAVVAQLGAGWIDAIGRLLAALVSSSAVSR